jgi:DNA invertase Pin-like site-specific DNA recombinase
MKAITYARFSPRALPVTCSACGAAFKTKARKTTEINAKCPACKAVTVIRNCESCESQLADLRDFAQGHTYEVAGEFSDHALSGGDGWDDRPGMLAAAAAAKKGMVLIVRNYDRLFRDVDKATVFRTHLEAKGVEVISASPQEAAANGSSLHAKLIRFVILWKAELDREITRARTKYKMLRHQANGRRMSKEPPFGAMLDPADPKRLIPNPQEQYTIGVIRNLRESRRMGLRAIARELERRGISRRGKSTWSHTLVASVLAREDSPTV